MSQLHNLSAIHIKDINLWAHVGVLESERIHGQRFLLDLSFWLELSFFWVDSVRKNLNIFIMSA